MPKMILLRHNLSLGDVICLTGAIRDLHRVYPGEYITLVKTTAMELWDNNQYVTKYYKNDKNDETIVQLDEENDKGQWVKIGSTSIVAHYDLGGVWAAGKIPSVYIDYPAVHRSNDATGHFIDAFADRLEQLLGVRIADRKCRGDLHLSESESEWIPQVQEITGSDQYYWIVVNGGKMDYTAKWWDPIRMQRVVDTLRHIQFIQVGQTGRNNYHMPLLGPNVINLLDRTSVRQLIRLVYHSSGVVCPVTSLMHMAAAVPSRSEKCYSRFYRPCVVIAGGREPVRWECYPGHQFLHTCGQLSCCKYGGCWRSRVLPIGDMTNTGDPNPLDSSLCEYPELTENGCMVPRCMKIITVDMVVDAIKGFLP